MNSNIQKQVLLFLISLSSLVLLCYFKTTVSRFNYITNYSLINCELMNNNSDSKKQCLKGEDFSQGVEILVLIPMTFFNRFFNTFGFFFRGLYWTLSVFFSQIGEIFKQVSKINKWTNYFLFNCDIDIFIKENCLKGNSALVGWAIIFINCIYITLSCLCFTYNSFLEKKLPINKKRNKLMKSHVLNIIFLTTVFISNYIVYRYKQLNHALFMFFTLYSIGVFCFVLLSRLMLMLFVKDEEERRVGKSVQDV